MFDIWFAVFLVASFLLCGTLYLLGALVFIVCAQDKGTNDKLAIVVPSVVTLLCFAGLMLSDFARLNVIIALLLGWGSSYALHHFGLKKWRQFRADNG